MTEKTTPAHLGTVHNIIDSLRNATAEPVGQEAWFLGGNAENADLLRLMLEEVLQGHVRNRRAYSPKPLKDPDFMLEKDRNAGFDAMQKKLVGDIGDLNNMLKGSIPLSSLRNQSHMYWDITLPSIAGYLAGMLHNQNNTASEASPVTTAIEFVVAQDLCRMLGYDLRTNPAPWGHITCGGTVANMESMWAARNLKFQGAALQHAILNDPKLKDAARVTVMTHGGTLKKLVDLPKWDVLNLSIDAMLDLPDRITKTTRVDAEVVTAALETFSVQSAGLFDFFQTALPDTAGPVVLAPATAHYSWVKSANVLGIGAQSVWPIALDIEGRMDTKALREALDQCLDDQRPVLMVVAVMGSTAESAVDPLAEILAIREEYRAQGMEFCIHCDAAWGGYFASTLRPPKGDGAYVPAIPLSGYVIEQFEAFPGADTITLDPHKSGFIPYPAGSLCYRNGLMPQLISVKADIVYHGGEAMTMGAYGIEGSKPGAAATAVYLSHRAIPPDQSGYGNLLGRCLFNAKRYYAALVSMCGPEDPFFLVPLKRLPAEVDNMTPVEVEHQRISIGEKFGRRENEFVEDQLLDEELRTLFNRLGPDLTVFAYAFNFRTADGVNTNLTFMNELNHNIFNACSIQKNPEFKVPMQTLFLTASAFLPELHGQEFCDAFANRAGVNPTAGEKVGVLISTMQNPWISKTARGNFIKELADTLKDIAAVETAKVIHRHGLTPMPEKKG